MAVGSDFTLKLEQNIHKSFVNSVMCTNTGAYWGVFVFSSDKAKHQHDSYSRASATHTHTRKKSKTGVIFSMLFYEIINLQYCTQLLLIRDLYTAQ